jgi:hypothetical protein
MNSAHYNRDMSETFMEHVDPDLLLEAITERFGIDREIVQGFGAADEDEMGNVQIDMHLQLHITGLELNRIYDACWRERNE